jgi:hypothetical protein
MKNRISRDEAEMVGVYYIMSHCRAVTNNESETLSDLDAELLSFVKRRAEAPLPLFGSRKQAMKTRRDIARYTLQKFSDSFANKHYRIARGHLSEGANSEISLFSGNGIMALAQENLAEVIERIDNPFSNEMAPVEQFLNAGKMREFIEKGIMKGLVKA